MTDDIRHTTFDIRSKGLASTATLPYPVCTMTVIAIRKGEESNERLQGRFKKQFQETRLTPVLRSRKTHKRTTTRRLQRIKALKREEFRADRKKNQFYSNM